MITRGDRLPVTGGYMSPADIAGLLDVPIRTVRDWRAKGDEPAGAIRVGKHLRYPRAAVADWLAHKAA